MKENSNVPEEVLNRRLKVGLRIRRERLLWDMTQEDLSEILGISANYLGQIERGNRELSRNMEDRLCDLFSLSHNDLHASSDEGRPSWSPHVSETGVVFNDLSEEDILRLLHGCTPGELQLCGHIIRSLLLFLRNPSTASVVRLDSPVRKNPGRDGLRTGRKNEEDSGAKEQIG